MGMLSASKFNDFADSALSPREFTFLGPCTVHDVLSFCLRSSCQLNRLSSIVVDVIVEDETWGTVIGDPIEFPCVYRLISDLGLLVSVELIASFNYSHVVEFWQLDRQPREFMFPTV